MAEPQTVVQAPGAHYKASGLHRLILGTDYRDLWTVPTTVEVLDLGSTEGGLIALGRTGGQQSKTLKLGNPSGRQFFFRSIEKDPSKALPEELRGTVAGWVVQDQIKAANPMAPLVVARLLAATTILHNAPRAFVLPDDPRLGEFRAEFAGLMGFLEDRVGGSGPSAHWHGAAEIIDSDTLFARVDRDPDDRVDAGAFLVARLFDVYIGDWDRHRDQWRWVRMDDSLPHRWLPVPIDRDQAFARFDGIALSIARQTLPKLVKFGSGYADMAGQTWNGRDLDRRFLAELDRSVWDSVGLALQAELTDSIIEDAVRALPPEHYAIAGSTLEARLKHRRDTLMEMVDRFYRMVSAQVDVHGTEQSDVASLERSADGAVTLALSRASGSSAGPYFERRFESGETREVRLFLGQGDDTATVSGGGGGITVRILGDSGSDRLVDSATGGSNRFYDADGQSNRTAGRSTHIDRRPYIPPPNPDPHPIPPRDWGHRWQPLTWASFGPDIGLFVGGGRSLTTYGFRKYPFASRHRIRAGIATGPWTYRVDYLGEFHRENSRAELQLFAGASGIEVLRFHGFGNETSAKGDDTFYRITEDQYGIAPSLMLPLGARVTLLVGPTFKYVSTDNRSDRFLATLDPYGAGNFGELGARASMRLDTRNHRNAATRGATLELGGAIHPPWLDVRETFGEAHAEATVYLSPPAPLDPTLALRAGGKKLWGAYPFFDAAFIGDPSTVRLGRENRYAGDASAYGSAELRLALFRARLVLPTDFGVFGLADAGRVFRAGESSSTWHTATGGGIWLAFLNRSNTLSAAIAASDERTRVYLQAGFAY